MGEEDIVESQNTIEQYKYTDHEFFFNSSRGQKFRGEKLNGGGGISGVL